MNLKMIQDKYDASCNLNSQFSINLFKVCCYLYKSIIGKNISCFKKKIWLKICNYSAVALHP